MSDFEMSTSKRLETAVESLKLSIGNIFISIFTDWLNCIVTIIEIVAVGVIFIENLIDDAPEEKRKREFILKQDAEIIERLKAIEYKHPVQIEELLKLAELAGLLSHKGFHYSDIEACILNMANGTEKPLLSVEKTLDLINDLKELYE